MSGPEVAALSFMIVVAMLSAFTPIVLAALIWRDARHAREALRRDCESAGCDPAHWNGEYRQR